MRNGFIIPGLNEFFSMPNPKHDPIGFNDWCGIPSGPRKSKRLKGRKQRIKMKKHHKRNR